MKTLKIFNIFIFTVLCWVFSHQSQAQNTSEIRVATFNIGMLNKVKPVPYLEERKSLLNQEIYKLLRSEDLDALAIQEAWMESLLDILKDSRSEYVVLTDEKGFTLPLLEHSTGMLFLAKKSLKPSVEFIPFKDRASYICGWGLFCKRGVLKLKISKKNKDVYLLNTHLSPTPELTYKRKNQLEDISLQIKEITSTGNTAVLLGDTNVSDTFGPLLKGDHGNNKIWTENSKLYIEFLNKNPSCKDSYDPNDSTYSFTMDRDKNLTALASPSAGKAPSQRNDWIISCSDQPLKTKKHKLIFNGPHSTNNQKFHLSDHFGVLSVFEL